MSTSVENIAAQAMRLSPDERSDLADRLWFSVHEQSDIDASWEAEIEQRIARLDTGEVECVSWKTVIADLRAQLKRDA